MKYKLYFTLFIITIFCNCANEKPKILDEEKAPNKKNTVERNLDRNLYWGDTHIHTNYSSDAYLFGTIMASPDEAFRFAKGEVMTYPPTGEKIKIKRPLDFLVVTDHAEGLGTLLKAKQEDPLLLSTTEGRSLAEIVKGKPGIPMFIKWIAAKNSGNVGLTEIDTGKVMRSIWTEHNKFADDHNQPGKFSAFIGWEWTSTLDGNNLHRILFTPQDASVANQFLPFSATHSPFPEDLWDWLDEVTQKYNVDIVSIPHNSNISGGLMFPEDKDSKGNNIDISYLKTRAKWEPLVEITQIKGTSESHPLLSKTDEFSNFELWDRYYVYIILLGYFV